MAGNGKLWPAQMGSQVECAVLQAARVAFGRRGERVFRAVLCPGDPPLPPESVCAGCHLWVFRWPVSGGTDGGECTALLQLPPGAQRLRPLWAALPWALDENPPRGSGVRTELQPMARRDEQGYLREKSTHGDCQAGSRRVSRLLEPSPRAESLRRRH